MPHLHVSYKYSELLTRTLTLSCNGATVWKKAAHTRCAITFRNDKWIINAINQHKINKVSALHFHFSPTMQQQ